LNRGHRDSTPAELETADRVVGRVSRFPTFTTGSRNLDEVLGGGYRAGTITLLYGRSNSGKTQLAMQAALRCAQKGKDSLFIDSEGAFRPERVEEMAKARGWDPGALLDRIVYVRTDSVSEQMEAIRMMGARERTALTSLVVVDTLTRNFTLEFPGRSNLSSRQGALNVHLSEMARDAYLNERAYLLTNRVTFGTVQDVGIGGKTVEQLVHRSVFLQREGARVRASVQDSGKSVYAEVGKAGVD
jgi:DNA repair protein RadA